MPQLTATTETTTRITAIRKIILTAGESFEFSRNGNEVFSYTVPIGKTLEMQITIGGRLQ